MPAALKVPPEWPEWIPTEDGIRETRAPFRFVRADVLASVNTGTAWAVMHQVANRAAFVDAWLMWSLRRLKAAKISAAATRELEAMRQRNETPKGKKSTTPRNRAKRHHSSG